MLAKFFSSICIVIAGAPALAGAHQAVCSFYSEYQPCTINFEIGRVQANLPTDLVMIDATNYINTKIYNDTGRHSNHMIGTATTILFGPLGLISFLATKRAGTVDFGIEFEDYRGKKRTAFIRFVNMRAAEYFGNDLKKFIQMIRPNNVSSAERS